jgi:hypothetical protein
MNDLVINAMAHARLDDLRRQVVAGRWPRKPKAESRTPCSRSGCLCDAVPVDPGWASGDDGTAIA